MRTGEVSEIRLKGLTSTQNDYECGDGDLQVCHNAVNTGDGLRPIQRPEVLAELPAGWKGLVFVHHASGGDIHIVVDGSGDAWWYKDDVAGREKVTEPRTGLFTDGNYQVTSVGNVMVVNFKTGARGLNYYRWKEEDGTYRYLGQTPPDIQLEFSAVHYNGTVDDDGKIKYANGYTMLPPSSDQGVKFTADLQFTQGSMLSYAEKFDDYASWVDRLLGDVNAIKGEMRRQGLFLGRFFVRVAYRLYDGTYIMQGAPVLIAPSMEDNPMIWPYKIRPRLQHDGTGYYWEIGVESKILYRPFVLAVKTLISDGDAEKLKDWKDVIDMVCVFVTPEIQDYSESPSHMVLRRKRKIPGITADGTVIDGTAISGLVDESQGEPWRQGAYRSYTSDGLTFGGLVRKMYSPPRLENGGEYELPEGDDADGRYSNAMVKDEQKFTVYFYKDMPEAEKSYDATLQHHQYLDIGTDYTDIDEKPYSKAMLEEFGGFHHIIQFERKPGTEEDLVEEQYLFYPLKEYTIDEAVMLGTAADVDNKTMEWPYMGLNQSSTMWPRKGDTVYAPADVSFVKFPKETLETLTSNTETLTDDYNSWQEVMPKLVHTYNGRLNIAGLEIAFRDMPCTWLGGQAGKGEGWIRGQVVIETGGVRTRAVLPECDYYNILVNMGYFYYPHPDAKKLQILSWTGAGTGYDVYEMKLKTHPYMHGAYFYEHDFDIEGHKTSYDTLQAAEAALDSTDGSLKYPNYMYTSEADNPFFFPSQGVNAIGTGEITAIKSATKAMSEGTAYGSMPLYAFCTDGVWPLSVGTTGLFVATNPPTRETLLNNDPEAALQIDNAIIFLSERGLMQLVGERTTLLSGDLQERFSTFDVDELPGWTDIMGKFGGGDYMEADDFQDFIRGARMAFDYVNYRIIVFRPYSAGDAATHTAYVYDIGAKTWATMESTLTSSVEGYPASTVNMVGDGGVTIIGRFDAGAQALAGDGKASYTTRPMKLGKPDVMKTARTLVERSISHGGTKYLALWGSRDMVKWAMIGAVQGGRMPRISGTPYKYFIVAGWSRLDIHGDTISRLTVEERDKYQDKIR